MDPERQPLLSRPVVLRSMRFRPLYYDEVLHIQSAVTWRRARLSLVLMYWAVMAIVLSIAVCILVITPKCRLYDVDVTVVPSVPPVHMSFTPLVASGRALYNDLVYTA